MQLLDDLRSLDVTTATDRDLCRLIGRTEVILGSLVGVVAPDQG